MKVALAFFLALTWVLSFCSQAKAADYDYKGLVTGITPFDTLYQPVQRYLKPTESLQGRDLPRSRRLDSAGRLRILKEYLKIASRFEYIPDGKAEEDTAYGHRSPCDRGKGSSRDHWQLPEETEARGAGDCEDKAIWLYARLVQIGFEDVRLVVGKHHVGQPGHHAWVVCYVTGRTYILDPTTKDGLWEARLYPKGFYKPVYSFSGDNRWCHTKGYLDLFTRTRRNRNNQ